MLFQWHASSYIDHPQFYNTDLSNRLADFYISVGQTFDQATFNPNTYTQCSYQSAAMGSGETKIFICDQPVSGRYVTLHFPTTRTEVLTLCEVAVYEGKDLFTFLRFK